MVVSNWGYRRWKEGWEIGPFFGREAISGEFALRRLAEG